MKTDIPDEADWIQVSDDEGEDDDPRVSRQSLSLLHPNAQQSYLLTKSGTIFVDGFAGGIGKGGINQAGGSTSGLLPLQDRLVFLCRLGAGASGIVYKALDLRDLRIVALKMIPMFERGKRRQMVRELSALFEMLHQKNRSVLTAEALAHAEAEDGTTEEKSSGGVLQPGAKEPKAALSPDEDMAQKARTDAAGTSSSGKQQHPSEYIVDFYDAFSNIDEGDVALMMEYMDGGSLQDIVAEGGCDDEQTLANIAAQALVGLAFLHKCNQLHRDVKPGNMLISKRGFVKIADFGILRQMDVADDNSSNAKNKGGGGGVVGAGGLGSIVESDVSALSPKHARNADSGDMPRAQTFVGTATYMAPERIDGRNYSYPSDIWSFGLSLLTIAQGRLPIDTEGGYWSILHSIRDAEPPKVPEGFSPEFTDFIEKCLKKEPAERGTAMEMLQHPFLESAVLEDDTEGDEERGAAELNDILWAVHQHLAKRRNDCLKSPPSPLAEAPAPGSLAMAMQAVDKNSTLDTMTKLLEKPEEQLTSLSVQLHLSPGRVRRQVNEFLETQAKADAESKSESSSGATAIPPDYAATPKATHSVGRQ